MANNRMYLINKVSGQRILLAKYYPNTGWYVSNSDLIDRLDKEFNLFDFGVEKWPNENAHKIDRDEVCARGGMWGSNAWELKYEVIDKSANESIPCKCKQKHLNEDIFIHDDDCDKYGTIVFEKKGSAGVGEK